MTDRRIVILSASPRPDGNSVAMANALREGAESAGYRADLVDLNAVVAGQLRDCRECRGVDGNCSIPDDFARLMHERVIPAEGVVYATPLYWYGMAASLKNYFDRMTCYISASYPRRDEIAAGMLDKRVGLLIASEERYPTAGLGVVFQVQEITRYMRSRFVGVVNGVGNKRGEVRFDPADPLAAARRLGAEFFDLHHSDYWLEAERPNAVWGQARDDGIDAAVGVYEDA